MPGIEAWLAQVPPITRAWMVLSVLVSVLVVCHSTDLILQTGTISLMLYFNFAAMSAHNTTPAVLQR